MQVACWSPKGGSGTTTIAVALAVLCASRAGQDVLLADCIGDVPSVLGIPDPAGPGLAEWLVAGPDVPADALSRLEVDVGGGLRLLAHGAPPQRPSASASALALATPAPAAGQIEALDTAASGRRRLMVADCGPAKAGLGLALASTATLSLLVLRPCYLGLRRALSSPIRPTGVVLVAEEGRSLSRADVADVLAVPVVAQVPFDPAVARAVDAGLLARRVPRSLARALGRIVDDVTSGSVPSAGSRLAGGRP